MKDFTVEGRPDSSLLSLPPYKQNPNFALDGYIFFHKTCH